MKSTDHLADLKHTKSVIILQHSDAEGPGTLQTFFTDLGWNVRLIHLGINRLDLSELIGCACVISMGGPMNVYETDKYPFLKSEEDFLKMALARRIPILGICLGSQMLAKACGAKVIKSPVKEIGWYTVKATPAAKRDALFASLMPELKVFQWHEDMFELPANAVLLATGDGCETQAFRMGKNAYGFQFHIEADPDMIENWMHECIRAGKTDFDYKQIIKQAYEYRDQSKMQAYNIYRNFHIIIEQSFL